MGVQITERDWLETHRAKNHGLRIVRPLKVPTPEEMFRYWNSGQEKE